MFETRKPATAAYFVACMVFLAILGSSAGSPRSLEEVSMTYKSTVGEKYSTAIRHYVHTDGARKPLVLFVHGYFGSKNAIIGNYILEYCKKNALDYFTFDGHGFGDSSANLAAITYADRVSQIKELFEEYLIKGFGYTKVTLVGYSMGGFVSFGAARDIESLRSKLTGVLLMAPAVLFSTGDLDMFKSIITPAQQATLDAGGMINLGGFIVTKPILDGNRLNSPPLKPLPNVNFPVKFIWGTADTDVPYAYSQNILPHVTPASKVDSVKIEGADHMFNRDSDKEVVYKKLADLTAASSNAGILLGIACISLVSSLFLIL